MSDPRPSPPHILVVEDDPALAAGLVAGLRRAGFAVSLCTRGDRATASLRDEAPDLVVLDLMLPGMSGHELLEQWRGRYTVPVIVLTARGELGDRIKSFDLGAIDFLPKPFWNEELVARIRARLRIGVQSPAREVRFGDVVVDLDGRQVRRRGAPLSLTSHEFNVLAYLVERPGRALSRGQIASAALSVDQDVADRTVDSHVSRIRKRLGRDAARAIDTVWGIGYRFQAPVEAETGGDE